MSVFKWLKVSRYMKYCMAIGLLGSMTLQAMAQYTGKVFVDENRNGLLDEGEKRLHRVSVSDGLNGTDRFKWRISIARTFPYAFSVYYYSFRI